MLFLEPNFRNTIPQMHYKLFDMHGAELVKKKLQKKSNDALDQQTVYFRRN